jgi:hypothetical protein
VLQRMYPIGHYCSWSRGHGIGYHTVAGFSLYYSDGRDCSPGCDDLYGAFDPTSYGSAFSSANAGQTNLGLTELIFQAPPYNVTISSLTLVFGLRTSNAGPASIDSSPTVMAFVDPCTGVRGYEAGTHTVTYTVNRNTQAPSNALFQEFRVTWVAKPGGGAWTRTDLVSGAFKAGFASDGAGHGSGIPSTTGGSSATLDWSYVYVELDTTPTGLYVAPVRAQASNDLRLRRKPRRMVTIDVPASFAAAHAGQTIYSSHELLPWAPGLRSWEQVPLFVIGTTPHMIEGTVTLTMADLHDIYADLWSPLTVTALDTQQTGLALLDKGGNTGTTRSQVGYVQRSDGLWKACAAYQERFTETGVLVEQGGVGNEKHWLLNSTFSQGSGSTFTSWTNTTSGSAAIAESTTDYLIDEPGFQRSCRLTTTAAGENCYVSQGVTPASGGGTDCRVRVWYKNVSGSDALAMTIRRSSDSWYWNDSSGAWQAAVYYVRPPVSAVSAHFYTARFAGGGGSVGTVTVTIGFIGAVGTTANQAYLYSVEYQSGAYDYRKNRSIFPTTTTTLTRSTNDTFVFGNEGLYRTVSTARGHAAYSFRPTWSHADLDDGASKYQFALWETNGPNIFAQMVRYKRIDATNGEWGFDLDNPAASSATVAVSGANLIAAGTWYRVAIRWTSEDENELDLDGQALDIWLDGVKGTGATGATTRPMGTAYPYCWVTLMEDGVYAHLVSSARVPPDDEMERL